MSIKNSKLLPVRTKTGYIQSFWWVRVGALWLIHYFEVICPKLTMGRGHFGKTVTVTGVGLSVIMLPLSSIWLLYLPVFTLALTRPFGQKHVVKKKWKKYRWPQKSENSWSSCLKNRIYYAKQIYYKNLNKTWI